MKKLEVRFTRTANDSLRAGTLVADRGRIYFEYEPAFLATGLNLSPFRLPFQQGLFEHTNREFGPLPGLFDDSLPDGWGLLLMDRHFRAGGLNPAEVGPLDRLAWLGTRTMGALTYHPPVDLESSAGALNLHKLAQQAHAILAGSAVEVLPQLLRAGGSPAGARPKVLVGFNPATGRMVSGTSEVPEGFEHWLVKFAPKAEAAGAGVLEYAYALMAAAAGVDLPPTRLFATGPRERFFGVRRFDREETRRLHVHTFGNLLEMNFRIPSADYADLLKLVSLLTRSQPDVLRAFRRMVFNVVAHNRDDHVKNFAFILNDATRVWSLSPAYDLVFSAGPGGEHTLTVAGEGRNPTRAHVLHLARQAGITDAEARGIIDEVQAAAGKWKTFAAQAGVSKADAREVAQALGKL